MYLIKGRKVRIYNANIIIFDESIVRFITANLSLNLSFDDLILIKKSNDYSININNLLSNLNIGGGLLSLIKANNIKDTNIDTGRVTYSGLIGTLTRIVIVINNTLI